MSDKRLHERKAAGGQLVIPVAGILFTLYYFSTIWTSPFEAQIAAFFVGTILLALSAIFIVKMLWQWKGGEISLAFDDLLGGRAMRLRRLVLFGLTVGFMLLIDVLGFTITTFLFLASAMLLLGEGRRPGRAIGIAAGAAIGGYLLFILAFETRFPAGPFETLMKSVLGG
ncbi:MAG: tripartite tricarboxylate transporter TctB family protein [Alphaproteobacteria bacterium]